GFPIRARMEEILEVPVAYINDALAALYFEVSRSLSPSSAIGLFPGTGLGGAVILEGNLLAGAHGCGSHLGHLSLNWEIMKRELKRREILSQLDIPELIIPEDALGRPGTAESVASLVGLKNLVSQVKVNGGRWGDHPVVASED